jgi:hypothetical protein
VPLRGALAAVWAAEEKASLHVTVNLVNARPGRRAGPPPGRSC